MTIWALDVAAAGEVIPEGFPLLHLTHQEKINIIARNGVIERSCQSLPGHGRSDEMGRDDDHQVRILRHERLAAEQRAEDRHRANPGKLRDVAPIVRLQQAGDREALAVTQLDCGARLALVERWDVEAVCVHGYRKVELAHRRREAQIDDAVVQDRRRESQLHTERLVLDANDRHATGTPWLYHGYRIFAAGQKRGGIARERDQIGLGQSADQSFRFQSGQEYIKGGTLANKICQRNTERRYAGDRSRKYWKADRTAAGGRTGRGYRISACVNTRDGRPAARLPVCQGAYTSGKASVASIVGPEPTHPE